MDTQVTRITNNKSYNSVGQEVIDCEFCETEKTTMMATKSCDFCYNSDNRYEVKIQWYKKEAMCLLVGINIGLWLVMVIDWSVRYLQ